MPTEIYRNDVRKMVDSDQAQLVEVLPSREYMDEHLPTAISIPLSQLSADRSKQLNPDQPVIVYCFDYQ